MTLNGILGYILIATKGVFIVQHISIRVPWTDNGFIGRICDCPLKNYACHRLKSIASNSSLLCQKPDMGGTPLDDLDNSDKRSNLPCVTEGMAFMSNTETTVECSHTYSKYNYYSHRDFIPSIQHIPPYSLIAHPFRWLMRGDNKNSYRLRDMNNIPDIDDQIAPLLMRNEKGTGKPVGEAWIQHHETQKKIFTTFFEEVVPDKSLCFIYAKSVPYVEDSDRILLGIAVVDKPVVLPQKHAKKIGATSPLESYAWECIVPHKIRRQGELFLKDDKGVFGGFLLPYAQIIGKIESAQNSKDREKYIKDLQNVVVSVPSDFRENFSYASEHVSHDAAISILLQTKKSLSKIAELGYINSNIVDCQTWIDNEIDFLWQDRPVYPGLGIMLSVVLYDVPGCSIAKEVRNYIKNKPNLDILKVLDEWISVDKQTPSGIEFTRNHLARWRIVTENINSFKRLARTSISFDQAACLWDKIINEAVDITNNPYVIYTSSIYEEEKKKISLYCVDLAFFVPKQYRAKFFGGSKDYIESANDPYRVAGFATYILSNACAEGHTYLPIDKLLERISEINVQEACITDAPTLKVYDKEFFNGLIHVIDNENGRFYKLDYIYKLDKKIKQLVDERIMLPALTFEQNKFDIELPSGTQSNEKAKQEQMLAAKSISTSAISVLCGSAGTGKTTLLTNLCKSFANKVLLLAPTGKARVRIQQNIVKNVLGDTNTIAGYLVKLDSIESGKKCYDFYTGRYLLPKEPDPNATDLDVIIDESSMLTEEMFGALLFALQHARRIIFVGDVSQLPPIGAGKPFYELAAKLKQINHGFAELKTQVRFLNAGNTNPLDVELAKHFALSADIRSQAKDEIFKLLDKTSSDERLSFVEWDNSEDLRIKLSEVLKEELNMESVDDIYGFNKSLGATEYDVKQYFWCGNEYSNKYKNGVGEYADKWQIIAPLRNRFDVGTVGINAFIHEKYRSDMLKAEIEEKNSGRKYPLPLPGNIIKGDKVINLINTKIWPANKPLGTDRMASLPVANGEIGILGQVKAFEKIRYGVEFSSQPQKCFCYNADDFGDEGNPILELAYAITVHKSQGSDFDTVILIMGQHMPLASREMLYTALTRQKKRLVILYNGSIESLKDLKQDSASALLTRYSDLFEPAKNINFDDAADKTKYIHITDKGERVISKSEVIVANSLARHGLQYKYEKPLKLEGRDLPIKPDFTIEYNGKIYYWEHLGLLAQESYRDKWMLKLELYRKNRIEPITSKDDFNGGIDSKEIERIIQEKIINS